MRTVAFAIALAVVAAPVVAQKFAKSPETLKRAPFLLAYKQAEKFFESKDVEGLAKGVTPDFTETAGGRTLHKAESMKQLKMFLSMFDKVHCTFAMTSCTVTGNTATTTDNSHVWGTSAPNPKTHKASKIEATRKETFTWVKLGDRWLAKSLVATGEKVTVDGKPMSMTPSRV